MGFFDLIDKFVVTNEFMYEMMLNAGYSRSRLVCIPTFVDATVFHPAPDFSKSKYFVFSGRLEPIKGFELLLEALSLLRHKRSDLDLQLKVAGFGEGMFFRTSKKQVQVFGNRRLRSFYGKFE